MQDRLVASIWRPFGLHPCIRDNCAAILVPLQSNYSRVVLTGDGGVVSGWRRLPEVFGTTVGDRNNVYDCGAATTPLETHWIHPLQLAFLTCELRSFPRCAAHAFRQSSAYTTTHRPSGNAATPISQNLEFDKCQL